MRFVTVVRALLLAVLVGGGMGACTYLDTMQREYIFRATKSALAPDAPRAAARVGDRAVEDVWLDLPGTTDRLHGWWLAAERRDAPTVLFLHGIRRDISGNSYRMKRLHDMGFNVLAIDYRGFGLSGGDLPQERWTYEDAEAAWAYLRTREPEPARRFIYGHSLGGAVAIDLATRVDDAAGLIVESTFTSLGDMAALTWARFLPVRLVLTQHYDSLAKIGKVKIPTLFVHGKTDRFVPYAMTERLYAAAVSPKRLLLAENASHGNVMSAAYEAYREAVRELTALARGTRADARAGAS